MNCRQARPLITDLLDIPQGKEFLQELGTTPTNTGEVFSGLLRATAQVADKLAVIRSVTHGKAAHERGKHSMLTGYRPSPAITYPSMGSVVSHEFGPRQDLPPYVCIPTASEQWLGTGYLSSAYGPFSVGGEPAEEGFQVRDLYFPSDVGEDRMEKRKTLLAVLSNHVTRLAKSFLGVPDLCSYALTDEVATLLTARQSPPPLTDPKTILRSSRTSLLPRPMEKWRKS